MNNGKTGISAHILPTSATLVGACITALSVVKLLHAGVVGLFIDKLLGLSTFLFLASAIASFISMRTPALESRLESLAEILFLVALALVAIAALAMGFEIS